MTTTSSLNIEHPELLQNYLLERGYSLPDGNHWINILEGGVSNRTVWVQLKSGEEWVLKQALEKLRVSVDWFSSPERVHREALGLRWLEKIVPLGKVPAFIFEDHTHHIMAMNAVPKPHENWKTRLLNKTVDLLYFEQFGHLLGQIHLGAHQQRAELELAFEDTSFFESLRIEPFYGYTATQAPEVSQFLSNLICETRQRRLTLVHGDYSPKNILIYNKQLCLLDYEVIHWGDPAFDLGFSLAHFLSKAHHFPSCRDELAAATIHYWNSYLETIGDIPWRDDLEIHTARHTLGCLLARVAGRSQLEYLTVEEKTQQQKTIVKLMHQAPNSIIDLVERFCIELSVTGKSN